ncbi:PLP-dependent aminotransferase family protein [Tumebacillus sp. ITR2]|uniref:PLP-dependent aminotransferase family protein n=1 Tax=Tumebacillus amylolyticus TaxID=2801339 RepID=A0ABS1JBP2_9BACL|nr:PLP-dependent aminotransferase family protein [Tumebacillus amylolyticus]MBL0387699.1 PLP-dependent aminotransferase family protein [Tumebacillus amylolyticus]
MTRKTLYQTVYQRLRYLILSGEWPIGSALPSERNLAADWDVSRNTMVRALTELEDEGLIYSKVGSGRYVQSLPPVEVLAPFDWKDRLRQETSPPSNFAELVRLSGSNSKINFAFGEGGRHTLVTSNFAEQVKVQDLLAHANAHYLTPICGHPELREWIVDIMGMEQVTSPDQVVVTSGSQEALCLTTSILAEPGDAVAVEMPAFFGALHMFQAMGLRIIPIPMDADGMRVDVLEGVLARSRPRFIYTIPTFHNPTGYTLSMERRLKLLQLSERYNIPIVEDDAYRHLHFEEEPPPSLKSLDQHGNVIYINTFSKTLSPGLRLGWVTASRPFLQQIARRKELMVTTNTLAQQMLLTFAKQGDWHAHLEKVRRQYYSQAMLMGEYLHQLRSAGLSYTGIRGGFYYWVALPEHKKPGEIFREAIAHGVLLATGDMFLTREADQPYIRLCFSHEPVDQIGTGMRILSAILQD